jgi:hypothetical protein
MQGVFIYACEQMYGGMHGIESVQVANVDTLEDANEIGRDMSYQVIYDYCENEYEDMAVDEEVDVDNVIQDGLSWEVYKIKEGICISVEELDNICCELGREGFIEEYCEKEMWEEE